MDLRANFVIEILKNTTVKLFQTSSSNSYDHCQQFALQFISFSYVGTATLTH